MRYARVLSLLILVLFLPTTLEAALRRPHTHERFVQKMRRFIISVHTRITIPYDQDEAPPPPPPPTPAPPADN